MKVEAENRISQVVVATKKKPQNCEPNVVNFTERLTSSVSPANRTMIEAKKTTFLSFGLCFGDSLVPHGMWNSFNLERKLIRSRREEC